MNKIGIGCGNMGSKEKDEKSCIEVIRKAIEKGPTLLDTADFYNGGRSEIVIGKAVEGIDRNKFEVAVKFGTLMTPSGRLYGVDVHPDRIKNYLTYSLHRLNLDYVDVYMPARIDLEIPVEETIGVISELVKEGYVKEIALSQVDAQTLERAEAVHHISYVESNYSLFNREIEKELIPVTQKNNTNIIAFGVLAHGLLTGNASKSPHYNNLIPLFREGNIESNLKLVKNLEELAEKKGITLPVLSTAWMLSKYSNVLPIIGMTRPEQLETVYHAQNLKFTEADIAEIEAAIPESEIRGEAFPRVEIRNGMAKFV